MLSLRLWVLVHRRQVSKAVGSEQRAEGAACAPPAVVTHHQDALRLQVRVHDRHRLLDQVRVIQPPSFKAKISQQDAHALALLAN